MIFDLCCVLVNFCCFQVDVSSVCIFGLISLNATRDINGINFIERAVHLDKPKVHYAALMSSVEIIVCILCLT